MAEPVPEAPASAAEQLEAIHAMLATGHRAIVVEWHSLVLWGFAAAFKTFLERPVYPRLPVLWQRAVFELFFLGLLLSLTAVLDYALTRRVRRRRDESYPFIQRQVGKCSILLGALGVLTSFGGWFNSWYTLVCIVWIAIAGVILYLHGLFSDRILTWAACALIALGVAASALRMPFEGTRWLLISSCGLGLPLLGFLLRPMERLPFAVRALALLPWVALIVLGGYAGYRAFEGPGAAPFWSGLP